MEEGSGRLPFFVPFGYVKRLIRLSKHDLRVKFNIIINRGHGKTPNKLN
jgi:hypothetical protein